MKRLVVLLGCCIFLLALAGCQNANRGVEVIIEGDGEFPETLAGKWRANKSFWEFVFETDGRISSAVIALGGVEMTPGKVARFPTRTGGKGIYEPGLWTVFYSPESRELTVEVVIKDFYQDVGTFALGGTTTDVLAGPVSEDGKVWWAEWFSTEELVAYTPEPRELSNVIEPEFRNSLIFEKVEKEE